MHIGKVAKTKQIVGSIEQADALLYWNETETAFYVEILISVSHSRKIEIRRIENYSITY